MKALVSPPMMTCAACGSVMLIQRPRNGVAPVRCLNKKCNHYDKIYAFELAQLELKPWNHPVPQDPYAT